MTNFSVDLKHQISLKYLWFQIRYMQMWTDAAFLMCEQSLHFRNSELSDVVN